MRDANNLVIYLSVRSDEAVSRVDLKIKLLALGANIAADWAAANFVVYHNGSKETILKARKRGIPVVSPQWVKACFEASSLLPWEAYDVAPADQSDSKSEETAAVGDTTTTSKDAQPPQCDTPTELAVSQPVSQPTDPDFSRPLVFILVSGFDRDLFPVIEELGANYVENPYNLFETNPEPKDSSTDQSTAVSENPSIRFEDLSKLKRGNSPFQDEFAAESTEFPVRLHGEIQSAKGHVVLVDTIAQEQENRSLKHIFSYALGGVPIVHPSWLYQCLSEKRWVSTVGHHTASYKAHLRRKRRWLTKNPESPSRSLRDPLPIFRGLQFYLWGDLSSPSRDEMVWLLSLARGESIARKPINRKRKKPARRSAPGGSSKVFAIYAEEDKSIHWHAERYAPIHQGDVFNSIEECRCTFYIV